MSYKFFSFRDREGQNEEQWAYRTVEGEIESCEGRTLIDIFENFLPNNGAKILEAGCGLGGWVIYLKERGYDILGLEYETFIIERSKQYDPEIPIIKGDINALDFPNDYFDSYISLGVIEHFEETWQVLQDTVRILQPGGLLYLVVPYANYLRRFLAARGRYPERTSGDRFYQFLLSDAEISSSLQMMGFEVKASFSTGAFAGLNDEFPHMGNLVKRLPYAHRLINGLNKLCLLGPLFGHVVHYIAEKGLN